MRAAKAAGAPAEASPHTLRHSRITHLLEAGVDIWSVAKLAGDRVVTIDKVYAHASIDHLAKVLKEKGTELLGCSGRTAPAAARTRRRAGAQGSAIGRERKCIVCGKSAASSVEPCGRGTNKKNN